MFSASVWRKVEDSRDGDEDVRGLRETPFSLFDAFDIVPHRVSREGEAGKKERLPPKSRELGRCCQDKVPVLLRNVGEAFGEAPASFPSNLGPVGLFSFDFDISSGKEFVALWVSWTGVRGVVGSSCSGGSSAR